MTNEEALRLLHAYVDGELDPAKMQDVLLVVTYKIM